MQPRENPNLMSRLDAVEAFHKRRMNFQSCIGRPLPCLTWSASALLEGGMYTTDRRNFEALHRFYPRHRGLASPSLIHSRSTVRPARHGRCCLSPTYSVTFSA